MLPGTSVTGRPAVPSHAGDKALDAFIGCLTIIWRDVYGRESGKGASYKDASGTWRGGPFVRFARAVINRLHGSAPTEASLCRRINKLASTIPD